MIADRLNLSPRQWRVALDLFTALVVISVAVSLAGLTWRLAGHAGTGAVTVPGGAAAPAPAADIAPALALAPFGKAPIGDSAQPTSLPLELKGVVAASPAALAAAFISVSGEAAKPFKVGEDVGGGTIAAIRHDRVLINNGGRVEYLAFPNPSLAQGNASAPPAQAAAAPAPPSPAPAASPAQAANPAAILQRFDAQPTDGGYEVGSNAPPGLQPGDVLQSVNGATLTDPAAAAAALANAQASGSAQIQILRDGKQQTLTVPLR